MYTPRESLWLEIHARADKLKRASELLYNSDFPSESPKVYCRLIWQISVFLQDLLDRYLRDWALEDLREDLLVQIRILDSVIRGLWQHLEYIETSMTQRVPWSLVRPLEELINRLRPSGERVLLILRPQWAYTYSIISEDIAGALRGLLRHFVERKVVSQQEVDKLFVVNGESPTDLNNCEIRVVSFPGIERNNVLLHGLLGHEVGHLFISKYITKELQDSAWVKIAPNVELIAQEKFAEDLAEVRPGFPDDTEEALQFRDRLQSYYFNVLLGTALECWRRGLEELLADYFGLLLFGPAMLYDIWQMGFLADLDICPSRKNSYYPPWRMRIRYCHQYVQQRGFSFVWPGVLSPNDSQRMEDYIAFVGEQAGTTTDRDLIRENPVVTVAYQVMESDYSEIRQRIEKDFGPHVLVSKHFPDRVPHLFDRLRLRIPPNAIEHSIDRHDLAEIPEIINAAVVFKLLDIDGSVEQKGKITSDILWRRDTMNRLVLKGIEYSHLEKHFRDRQPVQRGEIRGSTF